MWEERGEEPGGYVNILGAGGKLHVLKIGHRGDCFQRMVIGGLWMEQEVTWGL